MKLFRNRTKERIKNKIIVLNMQRAFLTSEKFKEKNTREYCKFVLQISDIDKILNVLKELL